MASAELVSGRVLAALTGRPAARPASGRWPRLLGCPVKCVQGPACERLSSGVSIRPQRSAEQQSSRESSRLATTSTDGRLIKEVGRCLASGAQSLNVTYGSHVR
jgi:hypothetical protein